MTTDQDSTRAPLVKYAIIEGHPGYRVGDDGSVWSRMRKGNFAGPVAYEVTWRRLKPAVGSQYGHLRVELGRKVYRFVHRLVLEAFRGPCPEGEECLHADGDPTNNRLDNLKWGTRKENGEDMVRHGTACKGERSGRAKLTEAQVLEIVAMAGDGITQTVLACIYGVSPGNIQAIVEGRSWRHVTGLPPYAPRRNRPGRRRKAPSDNSRVVVSEVSTEPVAGQDPPALAQIHNAIYVAQELFPA